MEHNNDHDLQQQQNKIDHYFKAHIELLFAAAYGKTQSMFDAKDAVFTVYENMMKSTTSIKNIQAFTFTCIHRECIQFLKNRLQTVIIDFDIEQDIHFDDLDSQAITVERIMHFIRPKLTTLEFDVLTLDLRGLNADTIASILKVKRKSIYKARERYRRKLKGFREPIYEILK